MPDLIVRNEIIENKQVEMVIKTKWEMTYYEVVLYKDGRLYLNNVYSLEEKKLATACFNRYKRKAQVI